MSTRGRKPNTNFEKETKNVSSRRLARQEMSNFIKSMQVHASARHLASTSFSTLFSCWSACCAS
jgi:hypothetical protein